MHRIVTPDNAGSKPALVAASCVAGRLPTGRSYWLPGTEEYLAVAQLAERVVWDHQAGSSSLPCETYRHPCSKVATESPKLSGSVRFRGVCSTASWCIGSTPPCRGGRTRSILVGAAQDFEPVGSGAACKAVIIVFDSRRSL